MHNPAPNDLLALLTTLRQHDIQIWADGEQLGYSAPPGAFTPELRAQLIANKPALLALLRSSQVAQRIPRRAHETAPPLSLTQQRMWLLDQIEPASRAAYNIAATLRLQGQLDRSALGRSLDALVQRHEVLRTSFVLQGDQPVQQIAPPAPLALPYSDLRDQPAEQRQALAQQLIDADAHAPFDLAQGPLLRARLLCLDDTNHQLALVIHHSVFDGWSAHLFAREFVACYAAYAAGDTPQLPELPIQYADVAAWQRAYLASPAMARQLDYWRERLAGALPALELPTDAPRSETRSYRAASQRSMLAPAQAAALRALGEQEQATLFMTMLAALTVLLARQSGQTDITLGTPIAGRGHSDLAELIGCFVNTLVLRSDLSGDPSFRVLLRQVRERCLEAYANQETPFELLLDTLRPPREPGRTPLFQVFINMLNVPDSRFDLPGLSVELHAPIAIGAKFDLTLYIQEQGPQIALDFVYNADLFAPERISDMAAQFELLLSQLLEQPDAPISRPSLLTQAARQRLPDPRLPLATSWAGAIHSQFAAQAQRVPEQLAVCEASGSWSYGALDRRANQLAHALLAQGLQPGELVGIHAQRSSALVIALLGTLKAGAGFLILDAAYPAARLAATLELARPRAWIDTSDPASLPPALSAQLATADLRVRLALHHGGGALLDQQPTSDPAIPIDPDRMAYLAVTSGTTGQPKGILGSHRPLAHFFDWYTRSQGLHAGDRFSMLSGLAHDPLLRDLFTPLWLGATLCIPNPADLRAGQLAPWLAAQQISVIHLTPALSYLIGDAPTTAALPDLRLACFGGDVLLARDLAQLRRLAPNARYLNFYGATETPQAMGWQAVSALPSDAAERIPLGRGIDGVQLLLRTAGGQLAGIGELGEIVVRTPYLASGYLGAADSARFAANPWTGDPHDRVYYTGDLGRYRPDGALAFVGRADRQVKLRGYRIELGAIEASLASHPHIQTCVVLLDERSDTPGAQRLLAYAVPRAGAELAPAALRDWLRGQLPEYMLPSAIVPLAALPLTPNGKLDRHALPLPSDGPSDVPPGTLEQRIAQVWQTVLGGPLPGLDQHFFEAGGNSLLLLQLVAQLRPLLRPTLTATDLFAHPTIRTQARAFGPPAQPAQPTAPQPAATADETAIAIVGMHGRFPGAPDLAHFWANLRDGVESIVALDEQALAAAGMDEHIRNDPDYVKAAPLLEAIDRFDAALFGISPREAELIDPQHRLLLECAWAALEHAGYDPHSYPGAIGVYAGEATNAYWLLHLYQHRAELARLGIHQSLIGSEKDHLTMRLAYRLNLRGPAVTIQTACSTALVAVHMACRALREGACSMALAGGVAVNLLQDLGYFYEPGGILSPDGHCRPFGAAASGTVFGSGVGLVVLKPLAAALRDGDTVYAVIRGSAINNDGALKVGYTAPSVAGQAAVITAALHEAGVARDSIGYIEAHGTGTALGDPIELAALQQVFGTRADDGYGVLGSVKSNIGHLNAAAGIAGLIKAVLMLQHGQIPASLHADPPAAQFAQGGSPFVPNTALRDWPVAATPRRAGVSAFGIGGTNAHVVLEQAPPLGPTGPAWPWQLLLLSAQSPGTLETSSANLAAHLRANPTQDLADVAYTLQLGRQPLALRRAVVCSSHAEALDALEGRAPARLLSGQPTPQQPALAFLLPGQGAQYPGMAQGLYQHEPQFRATVDHCTELLRPRLGLDLRELLLHDQPAEPTNDGRINQTQYAQPALFVIEYALAQLLIGWGLAPQAMIGHSLGEYVAACLAGVFTLADGLALVAERGRLMQQLPAGAMLAVELPEAQARALLGDTLDLAAVNGPELCVLSGPIPAVAQAAEQLQARGVGCRRLHTSHAFHSAMMQPILAPLRDYLASIPLCPPHTPYLSNLTGQWITAEQATSPDYWVSQLRQTVRYGPGVAVLLEEPGRVLLEVGPGHGLSRLAQAVGGPARLALHTLPHPRDPQPDLACLLSAVGRLWLAGSAPDWPRMASGPRRRVALPTYPFERQRYWREPAAELLLLGRMAEPAEPAAEPPPDPAVPALVQALHARPALSNEYVAPRDEIEQRLATLWQEFLGVAPIGIHDNFFELGGHSLMTSRMATQLRQQFGVDLPLQAFFSSPTVAGVAQVLASAPAAPTAAPGDTPGSEAAELEGFSDGDVDRMLETLLAARKGLA